MREAGFLLGASCGGAAQLRLLGEQAFERAGLVKNHAYSVLGVVQVTTRGGGTEYLVQLRNPWNRGSWSGAWSEGSPEWTSDAFAQVAAKNIGSSSTFASGQFWMSFTDFVSFFWRVDVCKYRSSWEVSRMSVELPGAGAISRGLDVVELTVPERTQADVCASVPSARWNPVASASARAETSDALGIMLLDTGRIAADGAPPVMLASSTGNGPGAECFLEPGRRYYGIPFELAGVSDRSDESSRTGSLVVHTARAHTASVARVPGVWRSRALLLLARASGKVVMRVETGLTVLQMKTDAGMVLLADNTAG